MDKFGSSAAQLDMHQFVRIIQQGSVSGQAPAFRAANSLSFPFSDISAFLNHQEREVIELTCLGLHGVSSPLPHYFITDALDEENAPLRDFLGIFNQQIYLAYFKAWESKHPHLFQQTCFLAHEILASLGTDDLDPLEPISGLSVLFLIEQRSIHTLRALIEALYPEIPSRMTIQPPEWIESHSPAQLGRHSAILNHNLTLGKRIPTQSHRIKIELGPLTFDQLQSAQSKHWITRYLKRNLQVDIQWVIHHQSARSQLNHQMCLGWNTSLGKNQTNLIKVQHAN